MSSPQNRLWVRVLLLAASDATYDGIDNRKIREREFAERWFRHGGSDFNEVCALAGLEPEAVKRAYMAGRLNGELARSALQGNKARRSPSG